MKHPHAISLATRLIESRLKQHKTAAAESLHPEDPDKINAEQRAWAIEILSTHLDACMRQGITTDLSEAVADALDFASRHETAYEPIPERARWHSALVILEEQDAD
ncbi:MAG TPA: hypothetical protein VFD58_34100 [Blastocatellia bacterium]|nr:hypothetical protein [Blastocatellia bacterium]